MRASLPEARAPAHPTTPPDKRQPPDASQVLLMNIPGLSLFYGGLTRQKNVLSMLAQCFACTAVVTVLWTAVGYSMAFSTVGMEVSWCAGWWAAPRSAIGPVQRALERGPPRGTARASPRPATRRHTPRIAFSLQTDLPLTPPSTGNGKVAEFTPVPQPSTVISER